MTFIRIYGLLLRLYPRAFYERFGDEMRAVFAHAWRDRPPDRWSNIHWFLKELFGLFISIGVERWYSWQYPLKRRLFNWRILPLWLFVVCFVVASIWQVQYFGYFTKPASTFQAIQTVDRIVLSTFDESYQPTRVPLTALPYLVTPDFPPSQILPQIYRTQANLAIADSLNDQLADAIAQALSTDNVVIGRRSEYPLTPFINSDGSFTTGIQPQPDGSLLMIFPTLSEAGIITDQTHVERVTANDWWYYTHIMPAGYIVAGRAADDTALLFVSMASQIGGDRYHYAERLYTVSGNALLLRDRLDYHFDIAGLEGFHAPVVSLILFLPVLLLWLVVYGMVSAYVSIRRRLTTQNPEIA